MNTLLVLAALWVGVLPDPTRRILRAHEVHQ